MNRRVMCLGATIDSTGIVLEKSLHVYDLPRQLKQALYSNFGDAIAERMACVKIARGRDTFSVESQTLTRRRSGDANRVRFHVL